ncbi:uncharacterized protein LOC108481765 [Gossypium arboreum]|uniref:uncharacterized protein LOC108481765 n=1 Tax=Gossypium arboreum TaxID=29729 RepID=UPI000818F260|nr:uncharacterized protein LOC108481765 [Gossypium arboreum]
MGHGRGAPSRSTDHTEARQPALVYIARHREDGDAQDVITACSIFEILGFVAENTMSEITDLSSLGHSVQINKMFGDIPLEIQGFIFLADLMELPFGEFDLILGMDWLVKHWVENLVRKGCKAFLAYASVLDIRDSSIKDIRTVKDFSDVFLEELLGLPSEREVEFGIELLPGTVSVSIAPYRMALKEHVELKA